MTKIQIFNVWHNKLYDELYADVPKEELPNLVMFGVNPSYEKIYTKGRYNIMFEYEMPIYNGRLQEHGYCQTTCMWHLFKNDALAHLKDTDYVGFIQYDMKVDGDCYADMRQVIEKYAAEGKEVIFHEQTEHILQSIQWAQGLAMPYEDSALKHYNDYYLTSYNVYDFVHNPRIQVVPLVHTFAMTKKTFDKMMRWLSTYLAKLEDMHPKYPSNRSQSELLERCHGLFLALECARGDVVMAPLKVKHVWPLYHDKTEYKNYKTIV